MIANETGNSQIEEVEEPHPDACKSLWVAILAEQFRLATLSRPTYLDTDLDILKARRWFGFRDFHMVCALAGLDGDWVLMGFLRKMTAMQVAA